jgi:putative OPT family oligopeptide transporter
MAVAFCYAVMQKLLHLFAEDPGFVTSQLNKYWPSSATRGEITPEYLGVGYIIGPRIAGVLVAGSVLAWWAITPLLATLVSPDVIALQLVKVGYLKDIAVAGGPGAWDPSTHTFGSYADAIYRAYIRQIGAGAVAAGGFITLIKTLPTIVSSFRDSLGSLKKKGDAAGVLRTERDLSMKVVIIGCAILVLLVSVLPVIPGDGFIQKLFIGILIVIFGFFFVTVASRIVGLVGTSNSPISGMTIATLMGTCLIFTSIGWSGKVYEPMALVVGAMICIAAANGGGTSQDLKTGYIVGATPKYQQLALFIGAIVSSVAIGWIVQILDTPTPEMVKLGLKHAIGSDEYPAPQATLMATLARGILSFNLDWQFVMVGVFIAVTVELCGLKALAFAIGLYLPLSTTLPIFIGGAIKGVVDWRAERRGETVDDSDLSRGSLFATGLIAGGALTGVFAALLSIKARGFTKALNMEESIVEAIGDGSYALLGVAFFMIMCGILYRIAIKK